MTWDDSFKTCLFRGTGVAVHCWFTGRRLVATTDAFFRNELFIHEDKGNRAEKFLARTH